MSASEVGTHAYCARSHWLQHVKKATVSTAAVQRRAAGVQAHERQGRQAQQAQRVQRLGPVLLVAGILLAALALWLS